MTQVFARVFVNANAFVIMRYLLALVAKNGKWYLACSQACHGFFGQMNKKLRVNRQVAHYYDKKL